MAVAVQPEATAETVDTRVEADAAVEPPAPAQENAPAPEPVAVPQAAPAAPVIPALAGRAPNDPREIKRRQMLEAAQKQPSEE